MPRLRVVIPLIVGCAFFMEGLDSTMIAVSIPAMAKSLGESPLRLNLVIASYLLSLAVFIPVSGWIADRLGTRVVFCAAVLIFAAGSALCGLSTNLPMLIGFRVIQGFGGAMMTPVGRLILLRSFPRASLVSAMNWMTIPAMIGPTVGPIVGGFLTRLRVVALGVLPQHPDGDPRRGARLPDVREFPRAGADPLRRRRVPHRRDRAVHVRVRDRESRPADDRTLGRRDVLPDLVRRSSTSMSAMRGARRRRCSTSTC